jgi:uncharacterized protein (DUF885 family)
LQPVNQFHSTTNFFVQLGSGSSAHPHGKYEEKISNTIIPAYQRISNFLGDETIASARETVGLCAQANGAEWYAYTVRLRTATGFEVRRVEPFREASASGGCYRAGTPNCGVPCRK